MADNNGNGEGNNTNKLLDEMKGLFNKSDKNIFKRAFNYCKGFFSEDDKGGGKKKWTQTKRWKMYRPAAIILLAAVITIGGVWLTLSLLVNSYLSPVDANDATPIEIVVESGWGASTIARELFDACGEGKQGLIRNKAIFKIYVDFMGKSKELLPGKYYLSKNMDIATIIDALCSGGEELGIARITVTEGMTIDDIIKIMKENGMNFDSKTFSELCKDGAAFTDFDFIDDLIDYDEGEDKEQRRYLLEGYLFPDTYEFYQTASSDTVIRKMLERFKSMYSDKYKERAEELDMSMDDVIKLASIIQKEAAITEDFAKVSAVFHNRLGKSDMMLGSDAVLAYYWNVKTLELTTEQLAADTLYNTHKHKGLPLGSICNPGEDAIKAALWPDEQYMKDGYLYFVLKDSKTGELVFAKTYEEHQANVEKYKENWQ